MVAVSVYPVCSHKRPVRLSLMSFVAVHNKIGPEYLCLIIVQFVVSVLKQPTRYDHLVKQVPAMPVFLCPLAALEELGKRIIKPRRGYIVFVSLGPQHIYYAVVYRVVIQVAHYNDLRMLVLFQ